MSSSGRSHHKNELQEALPPPQTHRPSDCPVVLRMVKKNYIIHYTPGRNISGIRSRVLNKTKLSFFVVVVAQYPKFK